MSAYDFLKDVHTNPPPRPWTLDDDIRWIRDELQPERLKQKLQCYDTSGDSVSMLLHTFTSNKDMHAAYDALQDVIEGFPETMKLYTCVGNFFLLQIKLKKNIEYTWKLRIVHGNDVIKERIVTLDPDEKPMPLNHSVPITVVGCSISDYQFIKEPAIALQYLEKELDLVRTTRDCERWKVSEEILEWLIDGLKINDQYHFTCQDLKTLT